MGPVNLGVLPHVLSVLAVAGALSLREPPSIPLEQGPASAIPPSATPGDYADPGSVPSEKEPEATIFLKDGQRFTGLLISQDNTNVRVRIAGIATTFPADTVSRVRVLRPIMERYLEMREAIGNDAPQLIHLAEWLRDRERYELALMEINHALEIEKDNAEAQRLKLTLEKQLELRLKGGKQGPAVSKPVAHKPAATPQPQFPLLTEAQVNLIKVFECDPEKSPRLVIKRQTITKLIEDFAGNPLMPSTREGREALYRKPESEILKLMFSLRARDLYGEVQFLDHPLSLKIFRDEVQRTWLVNSCATNGCHGGEEAGRLWLFNRQPNSEQAVYTNFLILDRFRLPDGTHLINYDNPERSPLLQMGLPRAESRRPHPEVPRAGMMRDVWKPVFRSEDDRRFVQTVEWIKSMYRPRPEYLPEFAPPLPAAAARSPAPAEAPQPPSR